MTFDLFISHASEDKAIARPIAAELHKRGWSVWFDEFELRLGDSLRQTIDQGLGVARFGLVILSPSFFAKDWPQRELDGLTARGLKILPIWHEVDRDYVLQYSPLLVDLLAVKSSVGIAEIVDQIDDVLRARLPPSSPPIPPRPGPERSRVRRALGVLAVAALTAVVLVVLVVLMVDGDDDGYEVSTAWLDGAPSGPVRYCSGEDLSGSQLRSQREYNRRFSGSKATFVPASTTADLQRKLYLKLLQRRSNSCDVIYLDVIYMAEFAAKGLLYDMSPYLTDERSADFDEQMIKTVEYENRRWGVPKQLDAGVLYYRADQVPLPSSWQAVYGRAKRRSRDDLPGLRLQLGSYEGLTVVFLEFAYAAGARPIISEDGKTADIDQPKVLEALLFMRKAIRDGVIPDTEPADKGTLYLYRVGRAKYLRGWPFVAARIRADAQRDRASRKTAANTRIASLPPWSPGGQSTGVLGGHNLVIPRSASNPEAALQLIDFLTSDEQVRKDEREASQYPVLTDVANDPDLRNRKLLNAIKSTNVMPRPAIPEYADVSSVISSGVKAALDGPADLASIRTRVEELDDAVQRVLDKDSPG